MEALAGSIQLAADRGLNKISEAELAQLLLDITELRARLDAFEALIRTEQATRGT